MKKALIVILVVVILGALYLYWGPAKTPDKVVVSNGVKITMNGPIGVATLQGKNYLVNTNGLTLYVNIKDEGRKENTPPFCSAECEQVWLPYVLNEAVAPLEESSDPLLSQLNVITRPSGQYQYALGTKPLYTYWGDFQAGDMNGQFTDGWMIATPQN